jgi:NAD(P)-dependent dehydrogenase (short-subunit alcohol dehydrogenase family)
MYDLDKLSSQNGKVIIVTGANAGLGFETAKALAEKGGHVIMACRNVDKATKAKEKIEQEITDAKLEIMELDLSDFDSVRNFATSFNSKFKQLDILINNAGIMIPPYSKTKDGFESQFQVNYLSHFLLTGLLLDALRNSQSSRVVTLSSLAHKNGDIHFDDLNFEKKYDRFKAYSQSKLACLIFTFELQRRLEKNRISQIMSTAAHPGVSDTELMRNVPKFLYTIVKYTVAPFVMHSAKNGAKPTVLAAIGKAVGGAYFGPTGRKEMKGEPGKATFTKKANDSTLAKKLWQVFNCFVGI